MKTRSVLVRFPGYPLELENLVPDPHLALWAGCLLDAGHSTRIQDYGTVENLQRQIPEDSRDITRPLASLFADDAPLPALGALYTYWQLVRADRAFRVRRESFLIQAADALALRKGLDFVLFRIVNDEDASAAISFAARLRRHRPELRVFAAGPFMDAFAAPFLDAAPCFDACCVGDIERDLVRLAEKLDSPEDWEHIPNLVYRRDGALVHTATRCETELDILPAPAYEPDVYPALAGAGKLRLFLIEDSRGADRPGYAAAAGQAPLRLKSAGAVANEIWRLGTLYAARAFRFTGTGAPASHAAAIAKELMQRGLHVVYGRSASPALAMPDIFPILYASGCRAIDWTLESGSQRLIEDYFGHEFTVSHAETVMSACRSADIFTAARFTYPTPADDYHTESETLRLLSRTRPDAVLFEFPDVRPGSVWYEKADDFGFTLNKENYLANRLRCRRRFPLPPHRWPSLPFRLGRLSAGEVIRKQEQMALAAGAHSALLFFSGTFALWAHVLGYTGRETEFHVLGRHALLGEGVAGVADWVVEFNERASAATPAIGFRPLSPLRAAVGN